jgi:hypothetical protein
MLMDYIYDKIQDNDKAEHREIYEDFIELLLEQAPDPVPYDFDNCCWLSAFPLDYGMAETMAFHLSLQLQELERQGLTLLYWRPQDILVIDKRMFLLANLSQLVSLSDKNSTHLATHSATHSATHLATHLVLNYPKIYPFPANCCAPELLKINELPFTTHKSASYYSLALLCLHMLNLSLDDLQGTKLFHFLERCLHINVEERVLLYI